MPKRKREMREFVRDLEIPDYIRAIADDLEQSPDEVYMKFMAQELRGIATRLRKESDTQHNE